MSNQDLEAKFRSLTANILNANNANQLLDQCWNIAQLDDVGSMMRLTSIQ
jgi:hypothetical protein